MGYETNAPFISSGNEPMEYYDFMSIEELEEAFVKLQHRLEKLQSEEPAMKRKNNTRYELWYERVQHTVMEIEEVYSLIRKKLDVQ